MYFPTKYLRPFPQNHPQNPILGDLLMQTYYTEVERKLREPAHLFLAYYSPYDVTYDVIGNPHYSASYLGLRVRVRDKTRVISLGLYPLGLHASSPLQHDIIC